MQNNPKDVLEVVCFVRLIIDNTERRNTPRLIGREVGLFFGDSLYICINEFKVLGGSTFEVVE